MTIEADYKSSEETELQGADLATMLTYLQDHNARVEDIVTPAVNLTYTDEGTLELHQLEHLLDESGVTTQEAVANMTLNHSADMQLRDRLSIPASYWHRMSGDHMKLRADNANWWLREDGRSFMLRTLNSDDGTPPLVRAVLSDRYRRMDDLDVLMAALAGVRATDVDTSKLEISCDRTQRRMYVRVTAPEIGVAAHDIAARYRDPRTGRDAKDFPMMWAGLVIGNSETGHGSSFIVPRIVEQVCTNGMTRQKDLSRSVHLGEKLDEGVVQWSENTQRKALELITAKTADAVRTFLSVEYVESVVQELRGFARQSLAPDPLGAVQIVTKQMKTYSEAQQNDIASAFLQGGDFSPLGVSRAVTNVALDASPDTAYEMEADAFKVMELAAAL